MRFTASKAELGHKITATLTLALCLVLFSIGTSAALPSQLPRPPRPVEAPFEVLPALNPGLTNLDWQVRDQTTFDTTGLADWSEIVFQSFRDGNWEIYRAMGDGSNQMRLTVDSATDIHPRLNRGCTRVAFASNRNGSYDVYSMASDGAGLTQLTNVGFADEVNPAWSPDGTKIAYQAYQDGQAEIYVMNADGSYPTRLTLQGAYDGEPVWSPDGTRIAYSSNRTGEYRIWVMHADGSNQVQLSNQAYSENPAWSPDGSSIAYDSDGDGDGWQEVWLMNADGSNQHEAYDAVVSMNDTWAGSWSPDGRFLTFTGISYVTYYGYWYWTGAYLYFYDVSTDSISGRFGPGLDWNPDWQTSDLHTPRAYMNPLPPESPSPVTVEWTGYDDASGIESYDIQVKDGMDGTWTDWLVGTEATSAFYPGLGEQTYYFRVKVRDRSKNTTNWSTFYARTTVENLPPATSVESLQPYLHTPATVRWGGSDPGNSGIQSYDVQYRDKTVGNWVNWLSQTIHTSAVFSGTAGHRYDFRVRGIDKAMNMEVWPASKDTFTTFYTWGISGTVRDNTGAPVASAIITTTPSAVAVLPSDTNGQLAAYVTTAAPGYTAAWSKADYLSLPDTDFNGMQDGYLDVSLPPGDNILSDWGFESGGMGSWKAMGVVSPSISSTIKHTGNYAAMLGRESFFQTEGNSESPQILVDENSTLHVVWVDDTTGNMEIYYTSRTSDGHWSMTKNLSNTQSRSINPQIFVSSSGIIHVLWWDELTYQGIIYHTQRDIDGHWMVPESVVEMGGHDVDVAPYFRVAIDEEILHLVWPGEELKICYSQRGVDGIWSSCRILSVVDPVFKWHVDTPDVTVDAYGMVHVVWVQEISGEDYVYASSQGVNGIWSNPARISSSLADMSNWDSVAPVLQIDPDGTTLHLMWKDMGIGSSAKGLYYAKRKTDNTWSSPEAIHTSNGVYANHQFVTQASGTIHAIWCYEVSDNAYINYSQRIASGDWSSPMNISGNGGSEPQIIIDDNEVIHLVWKNHHSPNDIFHSQRSGTEDWMTPENISNTSGNSKTPRVFIDAEGTRYFAWVDNMFGSNDIMYYIDPNPMLQPAGESNLSQSVHIPTTMTRPVLSFLMKLTNDGKMAINPFSVSVDNGFSTITVFSTTVPAPSWTHHWIDLSPWTGQAITLTMNIHNAYASSWPGSWVFLDEVTIGSGHPDLWVETEVLPDEAPPEGQIVQTITYGNQGGVIAEQTQIIAAWPSELMFVDADPLPSIVTATSLVWNLGDVAAKGAPQSLMITATISSTAPMWQGLSIPVKINATSPEIETANNAALGTVLVSGPDLWLSKSIHPGAAMPGEQVIYTLVYGNVGKASTSGVRITDVLPKELVFIEASPPPISSPPILEWSMALSGESAFSTIIMTTTVASTATVNSTITNTANITSPSAELNITNNGAEVQIFIGVRTYLPVIVANR